MKGYELKQYKRCRKCSLKSIVDKADHSFEIRVVQEIIYESPNQRISDEETVTVFYRAITRKRTVCKKCGYKTNWVTVANTGFDKRKVKQ